ncbi:hypothetical protein HOY34_17560 [Xinfangfangia sp. D13-10-4-6]|uniref:hypothetical protein n=1 Tax=Pseudogemmobacter hezensis TaxID=2737662 RepID=UPI0015529010|nr:hypothetical protein [Pseudogemmobacter hezensis]NPD17003.1 hypothetical protein [Pseudogemmobacter hezensis]
MINLVPQPRVNLSRLRDIGWSLWDPIGLLGASGCFPGKWSDEANQKFADEYDGYLIFVASQLRQGEPPGQAVNYLVQVETDYIGLRESPTTRKRAEAVVAAILADDNIWTWPDEQGRFTQND